MIKDIEKINFFNLTKGVLTFEQTVNEIINYILEQPDKFYSITVGSDSSLPKESPTFPVAIVVLRKGNGGRFFLKKIKYPKSSLKRFQNLHERIMNEVLISCEIALYFREKIKEKIKKENLKVDYEFRYIHADIGENGPTRDMIKEIISLIESNGFEAKIKPESFAASIVADKFT